MKSDYAKLVNRTLAISLLLAAALLAGCGGSQERDSEGEQGSQEETSTSAQGGGGATAEVVAATEAWLATLDDTQREQVSFDFDDELKTNWSNFPTQVVERNGVPFSELTEEQQQAALAILGAALSEEGYQKTIGIMVSDQVLADEGGGGDLQFGIDEYFVTIFGLVDFP